LEKSAKISITTKELPPPSCGRD